jgi:TP901 family phage tail tape measure protein
MADKLRLEVLLAAVDKVTAPLKRIGLGARALAGEVSTAETALKKLEGQQRALEGFRRATDQLRQTRTQLQAARQGYAELAAQTHTSAAAQKDHAKQLAAADAVVKRLAASFDRQTSAARRARAVMESRGISNPATAEALLAAQIDKTTQALQRKQAAYQRMAALEKAHGRATMHGAMMAAGGAGAVAAGRRTIQTGLAPVGSFMQHEDAMLGIARQVQGARDDAGNLTKVYRDAEAQVRDLSTRIPQTTVQIAEMMTAAARMEVPTRELGTFVELASEMATAFDAVPDHIAESMGKVAKNFKRPVTEIRGLADAINYLDDNAISKGADIIDVLNRVSGVASTVGITAENAAALGSTLLTLGERAETASTAINAIFTKFAAATKGTKKFKAAVKEMGMTPEFIQKGMAKDAAGTLMKVAEAIRALPEDSRIGVMAELVGLEHSDTLAKLVDKPEELQRQMQLANGGEAKGSMGREAAARNSTLSAQLQMQRNRQFNALSVAGETLKAPLLDLFKAVNPLLERLTAWMQANPQLVGGVLKLVVGVGVLSAAMGALLIPIGLLMVKGMLLRLMWGRVMFAFSGLGSVLARVAPWLFRLAGPVGWLILAAALLWKYWQPIAAFFAGVAEGIVQALQPAIETLKGTLAPLLPLWNAIAGGLQAAWQWFTNLIGPMDMSAQGLDKVRSVGELVGQVLGGLLNELVLLPVKFVELGNSLIDGLVNGIVGRASAVRDAISMVAGDAVDWFKEKLGIHSPSRVFLELGSYVGEGAALGIAQGSAGVRAAALGMAAAAMVPMPVPAAVAGPAIAPYAAARPSTMVAPAAAGAAARSTIQVTINAAPGMDPQAIARAVSAELDRRERDAASRRYSRMDDID